MAIIDKLAEPDIAKRCRLRAQAATTQAERDDWNEAATAIERLRWQTGRGLPAASSASHYSG